MLVHEGAPLSPALLYNLRQKLSTKKSVLHCNAIYNEQQYWRNGMQ